MEIIEVQFFILNVRIAAIEKALTPDQMTVYKDSIANSVNEFKEKHPGLSVEGVALLDKLLSRHP